MTQREKLLARLRSKPSDFTYAEAKRLLEGYGFVEYHGGKTSGSRVRFVRPSDGMPFLLHKPHISGMPFRRYQVTLLLKLVERLENED